MSMDAFTGILPMVYNPFNHKAKISESDWMLL